MTKHEMPVRRQMRQIKARFPDTLLLFHLGDTFRAYDDDATVIAESRDEDTVRGEYWIKQSEAEAAIAHLVQLGYRVAVCDRVAHIPASVPSA